MSEEVPQLSTRLALSVEEAAAAIGVSERHLRSILPAIPHVHLGGRLVIPVEELKEWLHEQAEVEKAASDRVADEILEEIGKKT